ncbi:MAG: NusG domain II-containing protein [Christensenellaceae bacterium]|nr:NusG domain II-containing protein [Christensenellaceae bacterium]
MCSGRRGWNTGLIKKADILLAAVLIGLSLLAIFLPALQTGDSARVVVRRGGQTLYSGSLAADHQVEIDGDYKNTVVISGGEAYFENAGCPGKDCVHMGRISRPGQSIACAPGGVVVYIEAEQREVDSIAQ